MFCHNVSVEPHLQPLSREKFTGPSAITDDGARLDIAADGFWDGRHERACFDIHIFNPFASSNNQPIRVCYKKHENQKRRAYNQRVVGVEHGSFTPLVLSATGGMGTAASICYKRIAAKLSEKSNTPYVMTMAWLTTNIFLTPAFGYSVHPRFTFWKL